MRAEDVVLLTPHQIASKFSPPQTPMMADMTITVTWVLTKFKDWHENTLAMRNDETLAKRSGGHGSDAVLPGRAPGKAVQTVKTVWAKTGGYAHG